MPVSPVAGAPVSVVSSTAVTRRPVAASSQSGPRWSVTSMSSRSPSRHRRTWKYSPFRLGWAGNQFGGRHHAHVVRHGMPEPAAAMRSAYS
ncbi:hypothetical protein [Streptomyces sp. NPDC001286]